CLRKRVEVGKFAKAVLRIETLDPGGEVYVNGQRAAVVNGRSPVRLDITEHLRPESENLIALKVNHRLLANPMHHCCADVNIGWFAGRARLELGGAVSVESALVHTDSLQAGQAVQSHAILLENRALEPFTGSVTINYAPWTPREGRVVAKQSFNVTVPAGSSIEHSFTLRLEKPRLWNWRDPCLYKVRVELRDADGKPVDDTVLTTGIRTLEQAGERLLVNGKEEMLNGVQTMGFRMPVETLARHNRCATLEQLAEELIMTSKCGSNMLRVHVHAAHDTADGINDPRIPEMCDQLGIMLTWQTPSWIREGAWEAIDFTNFAAYARQVYNSPSIVNWELSNHPNRFKGKGVKYSIDFVESVMRCVLAVDQSRLITPTTFWQHTLIKDDRGTVDSAGEKIKAPDLYTHPLCTRGTQDAVTGYGADWEKLRNWPQGFTRDVLQNRERPFFNWEHEESMAQPNWELSKGKPWHLLHSYEHDYDSGSIGRKLDFGEWRASQGFQAFSAYESMKKQRLHGIDGFSWCCLHGGANSGTYKKPLIDSLGHAKLAWHVHKTVFQRVFAGSDNVDVVYGPDDRITPVIMNLDDEKTVDLQIVVRNTEGQEVQRFDFENVTLERGRGETRLAPIKVDFPEPGAYAIEYLVTAARSRAGS
ncbi:MAG: glycosyl hydrolase family 2, partial [Kiritimatiellae bacterium]|nr:glycosyl hydrolase family 2 [Kiritimatiellia bacterium]